MAFTKESEQIAQRSFYDKDTKTESDDSMKRLTHEMTEIEREITKTQASLQDIDDQLGKLNKKI